MIKIEFRDPPETKLRFGWIVALFLIMGCKEVGKVEDAAVSRPSISFEEEKTAILQTLNNETKAAFQRDFEGWGKNWLQDPVITKTYIDFPENSFTEAIGWEEISGFVKTFMEEHPEPEPVPKLLDDIEVRLYGHGAWVSYEQEDSLRGLKRETRLMEKEGGQWKIAGMHTTIYGFQEPE